MTPVQELIASCWSTLVGTKRTEQMIVMLARLGRVNLLDLAHRRDGLLEATSLESSGEGRVIREVLPTLFGPGAVFFDVGAHQGEYSVALRRAFPDARITAFEPNPASFLKLRENTDSYGIVCESFALGSSNKEAMLYSYAHGDAASSHATVLREVFTAIHKQEEIVSHEVRLQTLDLYCEEQEVSRIDFLKLDTEGTELEVLFGARRMLAEGRIAAVQFEFNEMNVVSKVFLRDFYEILANFDFFRVAPDRIISLGAYRPSSEIFRFQNILCIRRSHLGHELRAA